MKYLFALTLLLFAFTAEAQNKHYIARKGEKVDYDTAVVFQLTEYRKEWLKDRRILAEKDSLIDSLKQRTIMAPAHSDYHFHFDQPQAEVKERRNKLHWTQNPILWMGIGTFIGVRYIR